MAGLLRLQVSRVRDGGCARNPSPLPAAGSSPYVATYPAGRAWHCWGAQQLMVLRPAGFWVGGGSAGRAATSAFFDAAWKND